MLILITTLFFCITISASESNKQVLLRFKSDIDKVGKDLEHLIFHVVEKIVADFSEYESDYTSNEYKISSAEIPTRDSITKKILNDGLENTTEEYPEENAPLPSPIVLINSTEKIISQNRNKRSVEENNISPSSELKKEPNNTADNTQNCTTNGQQFDLRALEDLKQEIKKLQDLVMLLRDQQKVITLLDKNTNHLDDPMTSRFDSNDLLKILKYMNNRNMDEKKDTQPITDINKDKNKLVSQDEVSDIKDALKEAVLTLNRTRDILLVERHKGVLLEKELNDQKLDLGFLKMMVKKLYRNNMNIDTDNFGNDILGANHNLPLVKMIDDTANLKQSSGLLRENLAQSTGENVLGSRASDLEDLTKLLSRLNPPKTNDIESKLLELEKEIEKMKQEGDFAARLQKLLDEMKGQSTSIQSNRELEPASKTTVSEKGRDMNDDIEQELKKLQESIKNLKPKDEVETNSEIPFDEPTKSDLEQFQAMFNKLFTGSNAKEDDDRKRFQQMLDRMVNQGNREETKVSPDVQKHNMLMKEIVDLRRQLAVLQDSKKTEGSGGYGYGSEPEIFGKKPYAPTPSTGRYKNYDLNYAPYQYPNAINRMLYGGSNKPYNQQYTGYLTPSDMPPNIANFAQAYNYFKTLSRWYQNPYLDNLNQNRYPESYRTPSKYYFEPYVEPNPQSATVEDGENNNFVPFYEHSTFKTVPGHRANFFTPFSDTNINSNQLDGYQKHLPLNYQKNDQKGSDSDPASNNFNKSPLPYTQKPAQGEDFLRHDDRNQLFLAPQQDFKTFAESLYRPEHVRGYSAVQSETDPQKTSGDVDYIYQKVEDLKGQIYNLQRIIDGLNKPNYVQTTQDKDVVIGLERQIDQLKSIINGMYPEGNTPRYFALHPVSTEQKNNQLMESQQEPLDNSRRRRSVETENVELYDKMTSELRKLIFTNSKKTEARNSYDDLQDRLNDLKNQLEKKIHPPKAREERNHPENLQQSQYNYQNNFGYTPSPIRNTVDVFKSPKNDIFTQIVLKILDKVLAATPEIIGRLFGRGLTELATFHEYDSKQESSYNYDANYKGQNDVAKLFKSLGFLGYGPLILLKLIDGFTTFVTILRKNQFFKTFLMPALIVLLVAGSIIFLVWWLQPNLDSGSSNQFNRPQSSFYYNSNKNHQYNRPYSKYYYDGTGYGNNNKNYGYGEMFRPVYFQDVKRRN